MGHRPGCPGNRRTDWTHKQGWKGEHMLIYVGAAALKAPYDKCL